MIEIPLNYTTHIMITILDQILGVPASDDAKPYFDPMINFASLMII